MRKVVVSYTTLIIEQKLLEGLLLTALRPGPRPIDSSPGRVYDSKTDLHRAFARPTSSPRVMFRRDYSQPADAFQSGTPEESPLAEANRGDLWSFNVPVPAQIVSA